MTAIVLGVALLVGINMATASALGEFTNYVNKFWGATDIVVNYANGIPFDNQTISTVNANPLVSKTAERLDWLATQDNTTVFRVVGLDSKNDFDYASFNITGSRSLAPDLAVVDKELAQKYSLNIGSRITIFTKTFPLAQNITLVLAIVGIDTPLRNLGSSIYTNLGSLQSHLGLQGKITHVYASLYDSTKALEVQKQLQNQLPRYFDVSAPKVEAVQRIQGQTAGFQLGLNVMVAVSLVVCSFIVFNTLYMTVAERTYEIGVMRAVGTSRSQIFRIFLAEGVLIGVFGATIGVLAGLGLARLFTTVFETSLGISGLPQAQLTPTIAATGIAAGLAAVVAGSIYPSFSASRTNIIQAIRPSARNTRRTLHKPIFLVGLAMLGIGAGQSLSLTPFHISYIDVILVPLGLVLVGAVIYGKVGSTLSAPILLFSRATAYVASKSGRRRLLRTAVSFGMITVTLSFVIMIGGIQSGVQDALQQGIREALGADIILVANQSIPISFTNELAKIPEVSTATPLGPAHIPTKAFGTNGNSSSIGVLAIDPTVFPSIISYTFVGTSSSSTAYSQLAANNETLMIPDALASRLGVSAGDHLEVATRAGTTTTTFAVAGVFTGAVLQYISYGQSFASDSIIVSFKSEAKYFGGEYKSPLFLVNLKSQNRPAADTVAHNIAAMFPKYDFAENSITLNQLLSLVNSTINRIFALILLILYFALLIATLGISATMIMNVADRRREIGLLRSQGMSRRQVALLFLSEALLIGLFGFILAVPGGLLLLKGATNSTSIAGFWIPFIVPYSAIVQAFLLALVAVLSGTIYPALRASRMQITKALEQI
ncbi:MAG TPA: FtsX-like permease family protein [Candidatus Bathyarchaeia archaeon]|nr:FtsX-like permease family protein [Candidatus Bathyarchaeia archaeon]